MKTLKADKGLPNLAMSIVSRSPFCPSLITPILRLRYIQMTLINRTPSHEFVPPWHNGGKHVKTLKPIQQGWLSLRILHNFQSQLAALGSGSGCTKRWTTGRLRPSTAWNLREYALGLTPDTLLWCRWPMHRFMDEVHRHRF